MSRLWSLNALIVLFACLLSGCSSKPHGSDAGGTVLGIELCGNHADDDGDELADCDDPDCDWAGICVPPCVDECSAGQTQCNGDGQKQLCALSASGCSKWLPPEPCPLGQSCPAGGSMCLAPSCSRGSTRCSPTEPAIELCEDGAHWTTVANCTQDCAGGVCTDDVSCLAGSTRCRGATSERCNESGTAWLFGSQCASGCVAGLCTGPCTASALRCNGDMAEQCNSAGTAWLTREACANGCDLASGQCVLAGFEIVDAGVPAGGEMVVDGPVTIRSGASLVAPSGVLTLRATQIKVESGGSIVVAPTGTHWEGLGGQGGGYLCYEMAGGGGGFGTEGQAGGDGGMYGGATYGSSTDPHVTSGSPGGMGYGLLCYGQGTDGGLGGGVLRLIAGTIEIDGELRADGEDGYSSTETAGGGGGSGGGILLAADHLTLGASAVVSATGGSGGTGTINAGGTGGLGRVKVLYGTSRSLSGTVVGAKTEGLLPPLTLASSTHPDSAYVYNDGFPIVNVSWNRAFSTASGYYYLVDANEETIPTAATAQFTTNESVTLDGSLLTYGANYLHVVAVDQSSNPGTVVSRYKIQVNSDPPTLASSSHPDPDTWYTRSNTIFWWTFPLWWNRNAGVHYVLDHFAETMPTLSDPFFTHWTTQIDIDLADGIWVLHMVAKDAQGYLTKEAAHLTVRVGAEPLTGEVQGRVLNGSAQPIENARVTVNRGLFVSTSLSNGSFGLAGIPAGTWELSASKPGYSPVATTITVSANAMTMVDLSMTATP